jgi:hypothetical protein
MKNGVSESEMSGSGPEPGASDNLLSLNIKDFPVIKDWEDGETYELSDLEGAQLRQISPGEFEVVPGPSEMEEEEKLESPTPKKGYKNPAVEAMSEEE